MANQIRLKRGSGSDPSASDLAPGELAVRTDTAKLFTKKDDNSVAEIGGISDGDKGDITVSSSGTAFTIDDNAVTYAKMQDVSATNRILGRDSSGGGIIEEITPANLRTMLNVADGATNVTNTNQLTNGAGFITATLTNEQVQDIVGGMLTGNTETGITVTYQDGDGTIDFVVGTLNQNTTGSAATLTTARNIAGVAFDGSANISLNNNAITNGAGYIADLVSDTSPQLGGDLASNGHDIKIADASGYDGNNLYMGSDNDCRIIHDGSNFSITEATGDVTIQAADDIFLKPQGGENGIKIIGDGAVELYHNNSKAFETNGYGVKVTGGANGNSDSHNGGTVTFDFSSAAYHFVNMNANSTFAAPINALVGHSGTIFLTQDGTGSRTGSFNSAFKFVGGTAPTLSTAANAVDRLDFVCKASDEIHIAVSLDVK